MAGDSSRRSAQWGGVPMKYISLIALTFQNSACILIMHYSRIMPLVHGQRYQTSTAVFMNEVLKLCICLTMALYEIASKHPPSTPATTLFSTLAGSVFSGDSWKLAIPAMLYTLQNSLQYVAISNLDAATFQVTYQMKILATAVFSVVLLGRRLEAKKWVALVLLMAGIAIVQTHTDKDPAQISLLTRDPESRFFFPKSLEELRDMGSSAAAQLVKRAETFVGGSVAAAAARVVRRSATYEGIEEDFAAQHPQMHPPVGLAAVLIACLLSGFAGVYFEKVLKDKNATTTLWIRNTQLSFYSLFPALFLGVLFKDGEHIARNGFFAGWNWVVWSAVITQSLGGVITGAVINYADNIAKNFATSISIIISFLASVVFFNFEITFNYVLGTAIVLAAIYLYSADDRNAPRPPPIRIAEYEKTTVGGDQGYFDVEHSAVKSKPGTPMPLGLKDGAILTTSRPGTPGLERHTRGKRSE